MALIGSILARPVFWILLFLLAIMLLGLAWRRRLSWWPAWGMRLFFIALILAGLLARPGEFKREQLPQSQVLVVDQSDSLSEEARIQIQQQAQAWHPAGYPAGHPAGEKRLLVAYGARPEVIPQPGQTWPVLDGRASNLEAALVLAGKLLGQNPGKILLASDGLVTAPAGVEAVVSDLARQGHRLDVVPLQPRQDPDDGFVGPLWAPSNLWAGTAFDAILPVYPPEGAQQVNLQLKVNGQDIPAPAELIQGGYYRFRVPAQPQGITTLSVSADFVQTGTRHDPFLDNNTTAAAVHVFAAPAVLFVTSQPASAEAQAFVQGLNQSGLQTDMVAPERIPTDLEQLESYRVIFLHNLLSNQLNQEQMLGLQIFVSRLAGGLVFLGGRNGYTLGGYSNTLLEPMLPVALEPPPRSERPPIVFLLVLDRSGSMGTGPRETQRPIALAREAAMRAIEAMRPEDYLGVLTFSDEYTWEVPVRKLDSALIQRHALDAVSGVISAGGTQMYQAFEVALSGMQGLPEDAPASRHILVLSDGESHDGSLEAFTSLARAAHDQSITVSAIAFGDRADDQVMSQIAEAGKGRFYKVLQADELPRILIYESQAARSENVQAGQTSLKLGEADHPILSGMSPNMLPVIGGYNALSSKAEEGAEDVLVSASFGDPILSAWQFGLGRVVAWTSDIGEEWMGNWQNEANGTVFWSQIVRYALVNPGLGPAQVNVIVEDTHLIVEAAIRDSGGDPLNLSEVNFTYADPGGLAHSFTIPQMSAGFYRLEIPLPSQGAYRALMAYSNESNQRIEVPAPFAVNPPGEWLPVDLTSGGENLIAWARLGGGEVLSPEEFSSTGRETADGFTGEAGPWWRWLLLALVLLWPLEIAIRRRWLPWM